MDDKDKIILAIPGELIGDYEELEPWNWRVGGHPVLPHDVAIPSEATICKACRQRLSLVIQVCTPSAQHFEAAERVLLVFGCTHKGCGKLSGSWRAYSLPRRKLHILGTKQAGQIPSLHLTEIRSLSNSEPQPPLEVLSWGVGSDWGKLAPDGVDPSTDSYGAKDATLQELAVQLGSALSMTEPGCSTAGSGDKQRADDKQAENHSQGQLHAKEDQQTLWGEQVLPEFRLLAREEPPPLKRAWMSVAEEEHIAALIQQYGQDFKMSEAQNMASPTNIMDEPWLGEKYEKVAPVGINAAFLKFKKRLDRSPEQCLRFGKNLLWPESGHPISSRQRCRECGAELELALQLMPALMAKIEEAGLWVGREGMDMGVQEWVWLTIAVLTCSEKCQSSVADLKLHEEYVEIVNE